MDDNQALQKLRNYTESDKSYYEATELLKQEGFTPLQINNATAALKSGRKDVSFNPELAESLISVTNETTKSKNTQDRRKGNFVYPGGGLPLMRVGGNVSSWWYFVPFLVLALGLLYYFAKYK